METLRCVECAQVYPRSELMAFTGYYACPQCKPRVIEKISRGEPVGSLWRDRKNLVVLTNAALPDRCAKCNAPAEGYRVKRKLFWHHPAYYLLLVAPLIYIIVAAIVQKRMRVQVGLCPAHRKRRNRTLLIGWALFVGGVAGIFGGVAGLKGDMAGFVALGSIVVMLAGIVTAIVATRVVEATRVSRSYVFLKGFHSDYLDDLPNWPGV